MVRLADLSNRHLRILHFSKKVCMLSYQEVLLPQPPLIKKFLKKTCAFISLSTTVIFSVRKHAGRYDVSPGLQANGYRSLLRLVECLLVGIIQILQCIESDRTRTFFRANEHLDKLEMYSDILHQLRALLYYAQFLIGVCW